MALGAREEGTGRGANAFSLAVTPPLERTPRLHSETFLRDNLQSHSALTLYSLHSTQMPGEEGVYENVRRIRGCRKRVSPVAPESRKVSGTQQVLHKHLDNLINKDHLPQKPSP